MRMHFAGALLLCSFCSSYSIVHAQALDRNLSAEVSAVRTNIARNNAALRQYTWTAVTEVSVKDDVKSSSTYKCRYGGDGEITRTLTATGEEMEHANGVSKRPKVRSKAEMQDYIERAITRIYRYVPPDPQQINFLLKNGEASLGLSTASTSEIRFTNYFEPGDTLVFTYDSASKALLRTTVAATLGSPKDPVTLNADFETLPDGVNHVSTATLNATAKKVRVTVRNVMYEKIAQ